MKYIDDYKLFKESSHRDLLYRELSQIEFIEGPDLNLTSFTKNEIEKIQEMIPDANIYSSNEYTLSIYSNEYNLSISKTIDEWYYVIEGRYRAGSSKAIKLSKLYKCDQFDGLIELIKNIVKKK